MLFVIHVTLVDGVAGFFFNEIALLCGRRLPCVSTLATLTREKANLNFGRYFTAGEVVDASGDVVMR